jgi:hypothetical protein
MLVTSANEIHIMVFVQVYSLRLQLLVHQSQVGDDVILG